MKLSEIITAIILTEIAIAIPILVGIYVWSMVLYKEEYKNEDLFL